MINRNSDRRTHARTYVRTYVPPYFFFRLGCGFCTPRMEDPRARAPQLMRTRMYGCWPRNIIAVIRWNWDSSALTRVLEASTWPLRFEPRLFIFRTFHRRDSFLSSRFINAWVIRNRIGSDPVFSRVLISREIINIRFFFFFFSFFFSPFSVTQWTRMSWHFVRSQV